MNAFENKIVLSDLALIHAALGTKRERFRDSVILVTGCAGFLGFYMMQYFARYADALGIRKIIGLDNFMLAKPAWLEELAAAYPESVVLKDFDIARDDLAAIEGAAGARFVIHMASIASPHFYRLHPLATIDANVWGLRRLLDFYAGSKALEGLLFFSSSEIYGDPDEAHIPTAEDYRGHVSCLGPRACYDEAKRFGETLCHVFAATRGLPIALVRPFNNYGPGMRLDDRRLPADLARCVMAGEDIVLFSDGTPTRTFCYIADAIAGYLKALLHGKFDVFNIGVEKPEISVATLAALFQRIGSESVGYKGAVRFAVSPDKDYLSHNPQRRCPVIEKARRVLGYDPQIAVEDGVRRYLEFLAAEEGH
jgi:UDP-glucuronate decarboxylase